MSVSPSLAFPNGPAAKPRKICAVVWFQHEYEAGWGVTDEISYMTLHPDKESAVQYVTDKLRGEYGDKNGQLRGAGDFFTFPSGADCTFDVYEFDVPQVMFDVLSEDYRIADDAAKTNVIAIDHTKPANELWKILFASCQAPIEKHTMPAPLLWPKPMTDLPRVFYPKSEADIQDILRILRRNPG